MQRDFAYGAPRHEAAKKSMKPKTKVITVAGANYQLSKLSPEVGSFILWKIIGGVRKAVETASPATQVEPAESAKTENQDFEAKTRGMISIALGTMDLELHALIQKHAIAAVSEWVLAGTTEVGRPLVSSDGRWANPEVRDNLMVVNRLVMELLVFNLSDFFEQGGLASTS